MPTLVLIRHGQSQWNLENRFTGWWDVDVTEQGAAEARAAGQQMAERGLDFDRCFTSLQTRAIKTMAKHGEAQVKIWRRSFDIPPPPLEAGSAFDLSADRRYAGITVPVAESLKDTIDRVLPYWESDIAPVLRSGERVLISAHGNSLRALVKHLSGISDADIASLEIPTGQPIVYHLANDLTATDRYYLSERG
jgi:2,3-bisphosphoglycerate-dependent phosphoglycerate mutase